MDVRAAVLLALLLLASSAPAWAAPPDVGPQARGPTVEDTLARLRDGTSRDVAWGAYEAGRAGIREAEPLILERLAACARAPGGREAWAVRANLLDAAIRLRIMPARHVLVDLARRHPETVATLLSRAAHPPPATLLAVFDVFDAVAGEIEPWLALGNRLRALHTPGFAVRLLRKLGLHRRLQVWSEEGPYAGWRGASGHVVGCGYARVLPGYPPFPRYRLALQGGTGYELLSDGAHPVYARRWETRNERVWFCSVPPSERRQQDCRRAWLAEDPYGLARAAEPGVRRSDPASFPAYNAVIDMRYRGHQPWDRELRAHIEGLCAAYWARVARLVAAHRVTESEARTLCPVVEFKVVDKRDDKRHALPPIPVGKAMNPWIPRKPKVPRLPRMV